MIAPWAQWFINHNLRYLIYVLFMIFIPTAVIWYLLLEIVPDLTREVSRDFKLIVNAKKTK